MKTLLFVCTGNTCRSPMAEALARRALANKAGWRVISAGLGAVNGQPPSPHAVKAMRALGVDISTHRSQMVTNRLVREADIILGLTHGHVEGLAYLFPDAAEKTFVLRDFDAPLGSFDKDISDPIGGPLESYLVCRDQIEQGVTTMLQHLEREDRTPRRTVAIAIGSDHAGFR